MAKLKIPNAPVQAIPNKSVAVKAAAIEASKPKPEIHIEGVVCPSKEEGLAHLYEFGQRNHQNYYNYAFLMEEEDGTLKLVERLGMPCWGAIREYNCGSRPDDYWPGDLREPRHIFPKTGNPIAIAFHFCAILMEYRKASSNVTDEKWNRFASEFAFNAEHSPWRSILKGYELITTDGLITGILIKDTKIDPTVMANMMKYAGRTYNNNISKWCEYVDTGHHPMTAWAYLHRNSPGRIVPEHFFLASPPDLSNGKTFYERESYNRPDVEKLWGGKDNAGVVTANMTIEGIEQLRLSVMEKDNGQDVSAV